VILYEHGHESLGHVTFHEKNLIFYLFIFYNFDGVPKIEPSLVCP